MRILHLLGDRKLPRHPDGEGASGVVRAPLEIARAQVGLGHEVTVAVVDHEAWRAEWQGTQLVGLATVPWARVRLGRRVLDLRQHLPYALFTRQHIFDVLHGHCYSYLRFLRAQGRVVHFHTDPFHKNGMSSADFATVRRHSEAQVAVSRFVAGELERGFNGRGNVHIVYNGVDASRFDPGRWREAGLRLRREREIEPGEVVFLFAGAIVPEKGVIHLARAFARLAADVPKAHLVLAGASGLWGGRLEQTVACSDYESKVRQALQVASVAGQVHFLGKVAASNMPVVYAASDAVVVPSVWRDPFPLVSLEALAAGRPLVASSTGGLLEIVNEQNGLQVPPGDELGLEAAMRALAENPDLRKRLGLGARQASWRFSWQVAAQQLDTIYRDILTKKGG